MALKRSRSAAFRFTMALDRISLSADKLEITFCIAFAPSRWPFFELLHFRMIRRERKDGIMASSKSSDISQSEPEPTRPTKPNLIHHRNMTARFNIQEALASRPKLGSAYENCIFMMFVKRSPRPRRDVLLLDPLLCVEVIHNLFNVNHPREQ